MRATLAAGVLALAVSAGGASAGTVQRCGARTFHGTRAYQMVSTRSCRSVQGLARQWLGVNGCEGNGCYLHAGGLRWACLDEYRHRRSDGLVKVRVQCVSSPGYGYRAAFSYLE